MQFSWELLLQRFQIWTVVIVLIGQLFFSQNNYFQIFELLRETSDKPLAKYWVKLLQHQFLLCIFQVSLYWVKKVSKTENWGKWEKGEINCNRMKFRTELKTKTAHTKVPHSRNGGWARDRKGNIFCWKKLKMIVINKTLFLYGQKRLYLVKSTAFLWEICITRSRH